MLALTGNARRWEPKRLRLRLFSAAGRLAPSGRRLRLRLAQTWPWAANAITAVTRLQAIPVAVDQPPPSRDQEGGHQGPWNPARPARQPGSQTRPHTENQPQPNTSDHHSRVTKDRG